MIQAALRIAPLRCDACGAGVPLVREAMATCSFCKAMVPVPPAYLAAADAHAAEARVRRDVEPQWAALTTPPPARWGSVGMAMVALLPPVATLVAVLAPAIPPGRVTVLAQVAIPALLPGAVLWLRRGAVAATLLRFRAALAAVPAPRAGEAPGCRSCGGALAVPAGALAATCGYCGTDSLVGELPPRGESARRLGGALRTLAEATAALRTRRRLLALGLVALALAAGALSVALSLALRGTVGS